MSFDDYIGDSSPEINTHDPQLRNAYLPDADVDAELLWYLADAFAYIRPSIVMMLAGCCRDEAHFLECLKPTCMAYHYPETVENYAGQVIDTFRPEHADNADNAYNLVMLVAMEKTMPDVEWQAASSVVRGLVKAVS